VRLNLKTDLSRILKYIERRCREFLIYEHPGPGRDDDPIRLITLGYSFDQAGWVALVFDTRPKAEVDGEWQSFIEDAMQPFDKWQLACDAMFDSDSELSITDHDGTSHTFTAESETKEIAECFGLVCREALLQAKKKGLFKSLPLAKQVRLVVEEHEGHYGWVEREEKKIRPQDIEKALQVAAGKVAKPQQIDFWLSQLEQLCVGKPCAASSLLRAEDFVLNELTKLGPDMVLPLLTFANRWAGKSEFKRSRRGPYEIDDLPHQQVMCAIFGTLDNRRLAIPAAEPLIQQYIRKATTLKPIEYVSHFSRSKKVIPLRAITPWHAARLLHSRFKGYPEAKVDDRTNELKNAKKFVGG
jgi:hypothetical protein